MAIGRPRSWWRIAAWTLAMLIALGATGALGVWQYSVAHRDDIARATLEAKPVSLTSIHTLGSYVEEQTYGREVSVRGRLDCDAGVRVTLDGATDPWIVCPLILDSGTKVAVVLGSVDTSTAMPTLSADVSVLGRLQPAQDTSQLSPLYSPPTTVEYLNTDDLVLRWQSDVYDGYVSLISMTVDSHPRKFDGVTTLRESALVLPPVGIELRNLIYAWQWWFFAAFTLFLWGRYLRDEFRVASDVADASA
ncbi:MAG: hypothetical protein RL441_1516 [Actinomycetota bacterium]|jgi:cytochrome oxidase assembly protein ShyY1